MTSTSSDTKLNCTITQADYGLVVCFSNKYFEFLFVVPQGDAETSFYCNRLTAWKSLSEGKTSEYISINDLAAAHSRVKNWENTTVISNVDDGMITFSFTLSIEPDTFSTVKFPFEDCKEALQMVYIKMLEYKPVSAPVCQRCANPQCAHPCNGSLCTRVLHECIVRGHFRA